MADGELTLKLDDETVRRLQAAADAAGQAVGDYVQGLIATQLEGARWVESRRRLEEYDRTGESDEAAEVMDEFQARVAARIAAD
jgi:hypothetical protein